MVAKAMGLSLGGIFLSRTVEESSDVQEKNRNVENNSMTIRANKQRTAGSV
jgi:hypothetical protein